MIIVSQDKETIINYDNIVYTAVEELENENGEHRIIAGTDGTEFLLGEYKTKERAKEVLNEIAIAYSDFRYYSTENGKKKTEIGIKIYRNYKSIDLYEMPKE